MPYARSAPSASSSAQIPQCTAATDITFSKSKLTSSTAWSCLQRTVPPFWAITPAASSGRSRPMQPLPLPPRQGGIMAATRGGGGMAEMTGLKGEKVRLVPPDKHAHLENSLRWLNDPEVTQYLLMTIGVTRGMEEEWFDRVQKRYTEVGWEILDDQVRHIGFTGIHRINMKLSVVGTRLGDE